MRRIGIGEPDELRGRDPTMLYHDLCRATRALQDPCVLDTFIAVVRYADGGPAKPWWHQGPADAMGTRANSRPGAPLFVAHLAKTPGLRCGECRDGHPRPSVRARAHDTGRPCTAERKRLYPGSAKVLAAQRPAHDKARAPAVRKTNAKHDARGSC